MIASRGKSDNPQALLHPIQNGFFARTDFCGLSLAKSNGQPGGSIDDVSKKIFIAFMKAISTIIPTHNQIMSMKPSK